MFSSGVSPSTDPRAMPAATWPGVPSECSVLMIDWISLSRVSMQGKYEGSGLLAIGYWLDRAWMAATFARQDAQLPPSALANSQ